MPSHGLLTPLRSTESVRFGVTPVRATNDALGLAPSTKRRRPKSVGTPDSNDHPKKRQRTVETAEDTGPVRCLI